MVFIRSSLTTLFVGAALTLLNTVNASSPHTSCKAGYFALTYDDGPFEYTAELLGLLAKNKIRATFFVNGKNFW
jgi:peptidoglycan/xylan/chitin deacetylase (PgdA/CDA1 family)